MRSQKLAIKKGVPEPEENGQKHQMTDRTIEDIVLANDTRGISQLREHLPSNFVEVAADQVLQNKGKALIVTGFYIAVAGAPETDG